MVVKLTQKQANFIESFKTDAKEKCVYSESNDVKHGEEMPVWASVALKNLSRIGFGYGFTDYNDNEIEFGEGFEHENIPTLMDAVINGYEVEKPKVIFYNYNADDADFTKYYSLGMNRVITGKEKDAKHIEVGSEEYDLFKKLGWLTKNV